MNRIADPLNSRVQRGRTGQFINPKSQIPNLKQIPNFKTQNASDLQVLDPKCRLLKQRPEFPWCLGFGAWDLFEIWNLEFGIWLVTLSWNHRRDRTHAS